MNVWEPKYWENTGFNSMWDVCGLLSKMSSGAKAKKYWSNQVGLMRSCPKRREREEKLFWGLKVDKKAHENVRSRGP